MQLTDEIKQRLPLPLGVYKAGYFGDAREVVAYVITNDTHMVRYDWIDPEGKKLTFIADNIERMEDLSDGFELSLFKRRMEYTKARFGKL